MSKKPRLVLILISVIILFVMLNQWHKQHIKTETISSAELAFNNLPARSDFMLLDKRYKGNWKLHEAEVLAVYATDSSPKSVCEYYQSSLKAIPWPGTEQVDCRSFKSHSGIYYGLSLMLDDKTNGHTLFFEINSGTLPDNKKGLHYIPGSSIVKARSIGKKTIASVSVRYYENMEKALRDCPGEGGETCRHANWEEIVH